MLSYLALGNNEFMSNAFVPDENNQPIHLKWRKEVVLNYDKLCEENNHIEAYKAHHRYTNYGWNWKKIAQFYDVSFNPFCQLKN